ncbi:hypothetical protein Dimus_006766 [Dionaea muscipula]
MASAAATLALSSWPCSSTRLRRITTHKQRSTLPFLSPISPSPSSSVSLLPQGLALSPVISSRPTFPSVPKYSESEAAVLESDAEATESPRAEAAQLVQAAIPAPKREGIFAVVMVGSRQYIVFPGRWIYTQRLKGANVNDKIILSKVLLVATNTTTYIGKPVVTNAAVHAVVEDQLLDDKVIVFKFKKKKNYRRNIGHRQPITRIRIIAITGYEDYPAVTLDSLTSMES